MVRLLWIVPSFAALAVVPRLAHACIGAPPPAERFEVAGQGLEREAVVLSPPVEVRAAVVHHQAEEPSGCEPAAKCGGGDYDAVVVSVTPPEGIDPEAIGYRIRVVSGTVPEGLDIERDVASPLYGEDLVFFGAGTEPLELLLEVSTLDRLGNESAPVEVLVADEGSPHPADARGGCSAAGRAGAPWLLALAGLLPLRLRASRR
ncbi:hypothetical protein [Vulgatibacter sp.]|uniref:hypothetical protein n=1 Tax=Vulgatibacter sp. TaxID=1971226 RepID=UPI00356405D9